MKIGTSAPIYRNMANLYKESTDLQTKLAEYFILVVEICHEVLKYSQTTAFQKYLTSLSNVVSGKCSKLEAWATLIKEEVSLLMAINLQAATEDNRKHHGLSKQTIDQAELRRRSKLKQEALNTASRHDHDLVWKQIRKAGTTLLFEKDPKYID